MFRTRLNGRTHPKHRGQAFVEFALVLPILLITIAGMVEVTFSFNDYLQMLDGARNSARDSANLHPYPKASSAYDSITDCATTNNFFRRTACNAEIFLNPIDIRREGPSPFNGNQCIDRETEPEKFVNDIVLSIFTTAIVDGAGGPEFRVERFDSSDYNGGNPRLSLDDGGSPGGAESGWSFMHDQYGPPPVRGMCSAFQTDTDITPLLLGDSSPANAAPNTAYLLVEVFYRHYQLFDLPVFGDVIENPIPLHAYAIFSLSAAEPTPTPEP